MNNTHFNDLIQGFSPPSHPFIALDMEWQNSDRAPDKKPNELLSIQWSCIDADGGYWEGIHYPKKRLKLSQILSLILEQHYHGKVWPGIVTLLAHHTPAEISMMDDCLYIMEDEAVRIVRGVFVTPQDGMKQKDREGIPVRSSGGRTRYIKVRIRDTRLIAPAKKNKLADCGKSLGLPKVELPEGYSIANMKRLLQERPSDFENYAVWDARICLAYALMVLEFNRKINGRGREGDDPGLPLTIASMFVKKAISGWQSSDMWSCQIGGELHESWMGYYRYHSHGGMKREPVAKLKDFRAFAADAYRGGCNEASSHGFRTGTFRDIDMKSAYTTIKALVRVPDYDHLNQTTNPDDFTYGGLGFARLNGFKFPPNVRYPCIPVSNKAHGLIYPHEAEWKGNWAGHTKPLIAGSAEIALARDLGAELDIAIGVVVPPRRGHQVVDDKVVIEESSLRPFLLFIRMINELRYKKYPADKFPLENALAKEGGNSLYGKTAQGTQGSKVRNTTTADMELTPESQISCPFIAQQITSMARAYLREAANRLPSSCEITHMITDGLCTDATYDDCYKAFSEGELGKLYMEAREKVDPDGDRMPIECKGVAQGMMIARTRIHAGIRGDEIFDANEDESDDDKPIFARGGLRPLDDLSTREQMVWLKKLFVERTPSLKIPKETITTANEMWRKGHDMVTVRSEARLNLDYDLKREPVDVSESGGLLYFTTRAWSTYEQYLEAKHAWKRWCKKGNILKTLDDWNLYQQFLHTRQMGKKACAEETRKKRMIKAVHRQAASSSTPTRITYADLAPLREKYDVEFKRGSFDRISSEAKRGKLPKADIIKATVTCTDIAGDLPWDMEQDRGSFVIRYRGVAEIEE